MTNKELADWSLEQLKNGFILSNRGNSKRFDGKAFWCKGKDDHILWFKSPSMYIANSPTVTRTFEHWLKVVEEELEDKSLFVMDIPEILKPYFGYGKAKEPDYNYLFGG